MFSKGSLFKQVIVLALVLSLVSIPFTGKTSADSEDLVIELDGPPVHVFSYSTKYGGQGLKVYIPDSYAGDKIQFSTRSGRHYFYLGYDDPYTGEFTVRSWDCFMSDSLEVPVIPGQWAYLNVAVCGDYVKRGGSPSDVEVRVESILAEPEPEPSPTPATDTIEVSFIIENIHSSPIAVDVYADSSDLDRTVTVYGNSYEIFSLDFAEPGFHFALFGWANPVTGQAEDYDWIYYNLTQDTLVEITIPESIPAASTPSPTYKPTPIPETSPSPTPTPYSSPGAPTETAEIIDNFAEVVGEFPLLFSDGDDSTYVRGGILAGDYDAKFKLEAQHTEPLRFTTRVKCIAGGCGGEEVCGYRFYAKNVQTGEFDRIGGIPWDPPGIHQYEFTLEKADRYLQDGNVEFWFSFHCNMDGYVTELTQIKSSSGTEPTPTTPAPPTPPEPSPTTPLPTPSPETIPPSTEVVEGMLEAEEDLYLAMRELVVTDPDGYIATYSKFYADIIIDYYQCHQAKGWLGLWGNNESDVADTPEAVWDMFVGQLWGTTREAMNRFGLEIPPQIDAYLGPDMFDSFMKRAADIEKGAMNEFLEQGALSYGLWVACYAGARWVVYSDDLAHLASEHDVFRNYWLARDDIELSAAFGGDENVYRFIEILEASATRFRDKSLKEYSFKSDSALLGDSPTGQVARATWEFAQGIDSWDSRGQWICKREINKLPRSLMGSSYFKSCKSVWSAIDIIGKAIPYGGQVSKVVDDIGFTGGYLATLILAHSAMQQDIGAMTGILSELNLYSQQSGNDPGRFANFVDTYFGIEGV